MKQQNIVIVGQQPWDTAIGSNCKDIALEFSQNNRVLYVNSPLDRITAIRDRRDPVVRTRLDVISGKRDGLVKVRENLWNLYPDCLVESINWLNNRWVFDFINRLNNNRFAGSIRRALTSLGFDRFYLFNDNEIIKCCYLVEHLQPELSVYYSRDYILATPYWKKHGTWLEPKVIAANDVCVANSMYLADYCRQYNEQSYDVGQGCDLEKFSADADLSVPAELQDIRTPVIGYVGALQSIRLDVSLIESIAFSRPEYTIVLVGPEDEVFRESRLHAMENVLFVGLKPLSELAGYIAGFDVCVNPQSVNPLTIGNYPRKIDEYLSFGKPVVATHTRAMELFKDYVYLAADRNEYLRFIDLALQEDPSIHQAARRRFASQHTWENSVKAIYAVMEQGLKKKNAIKAEFV